MWGRDVFAGCPFTISSPQSVSELLFERLKLPVPPGAKWLVCTFDSTLMLARLFSSALLFHTLFHTSEPPWRPNLTCVQN